MLGEKHVEVARNEAARLWPGHVLAEGKEHGAMELPCGEVDVAGGEETGVDEVREDRALQCSTAAAAADRRAARQMAGQLPLCTRMRQPRFMRKGPCVTKEMRFSS